MIQFLLRFCREYTDQDARKLYYRKKLFGRVYTLREEPLPEASRRKLAELVESWDLNAY